MQKITVEGPISPAQYRRIWVDSNSQKILFVEKSEITIFQILRQFDLKNRLGQLFQWSILS